MTKEKFLELLSLAKEDKKGRLYIDGKYNNKIYFGTITTICEDIFDEHGCEGDEIYDRHWWGDDTLQCYIIKNEKGIEIKKEKLKELCDTCEEAHRNLGHLGGCPFKDEENNYCKLYQLIKEELEKENKQ